MPTNTPALMMPRARPRCLGGRESETSETLAGAMTASPTATPMRAPNSLANELAKAASAVISDQVKIPAARTRLRRQRSIAQPSGSAITE